MIVGLLLIVLAATSVLPLDIKVARAQRISAPLWARTFGAMGVDSAGVVRQTLDGGFIIAGYTTSFGMGSADVWILKLDPSGSIVWQRTYGGPGADLPSSIIVTPDGGFVVAGTTEVLGNSHAWMFKLDPTGNVLWQKAYGGSFGGIDGFSLQKTADGGFILSGDFVFKLDDRGNIVWQRKYGAIIDSAQQALDGGFILLGNIFSIGADGGDASVTKVDSTGNIVWQRAYGGSGDDHAYSIEPSVDGGFVVAGSSNSFSGGFRDAWVFKLSSSGNIEWHRAFGGRTPGAFSEAYDIRQTLDQGFIVAGYTSGFGAGLNDGWLLKLDGGGNISWQRTFGGSRYDVLGSVDQTSDGGFVAAGYMQVEPVASQNIDALVLRLDPDGSIPHCHIMGSSDAAVTVTNATVTTISQIASNTTASATNTSATVTTTTAMSRIQCFQP